MNKRQLVAAYKIGATYIGAVIGAGFASGQEILQFFILTELGLISIFFATALFIGFGYIILCTAHKRRISSYRTLLAYVGGAKVAVVLDVLLFLFLCGAFSAMVAGTGAVFTEQFGLNYMLGSLFLVAVSTATVVGGLDKLIGALSIFAPLLLGGIFLLLSLSLAGAGEVSTVWVPAIPEQAAKLPNFLRSGLLYASFNLLLALGVLVPLGAETESEVVIKLGAIIGGAGLGLSTLAIYLVLQLHPLSYHLEIPMLHIARRLLFGFHWLYSLVLLAEIYTTAVTNMYAIVSRIAGFRKRPALLPTLLVGAVGIIGSRAGFSGLVKNFYPLMGYAGIAFLLLLLYRHITK